MAASPSFGHAEKSTTGRTKKGPPLALRAVRGGMGVLSRVSPASAAAVAERMFLTPRRRARPPFEVEALATARRVPLPTPHGPLAAWEWGAEGPRVLLVHGWEGRGAQLAAIAAQLVTTGFRVVTFDAPGHGDSPGKGSSFFHFAASISAAEQHLGPFHAIVAHSMGGACTLWANRTRPLASRLVLIAPPLDLRDFTRALSTMLGIPEGVRERIHARLSTRFGVRIEDVHAEKVASSMRGPLLVVHDQGDREVPIACGEAIARAWPGAELVRTSGLGHQRIVRHAPTIDVIVRFVAQGATDATAADRSAS